VAGPATVAGAALIEYACDVRPGALTINLPTLSAGQVVMVVWVAGSLTANPITVNAPGGVVLGLPTGLGFSGSTAASIVFNNDAMAPFAFGWWNYGISGIYNIK
jgi:hypothetical protein